jgi:hypothetical protein
VPDHGALRRGDPTWLGPYQLIGRLGEGGQGVVYAGLAPGGGRVAVKVLQANLADDAGARRRFLREAAVARRVAGFCTAKVLDVGVADERPKPIAVSGGSASDRAVRVWDLTTGRPIGKPLTGHGGWIGGVAVTQRLDRPIAVSGSYDGTLRAWDLTTGQQLGTPFTGHKGGVNAVAIVEGGTHPVAVSGGSDGTVRRWSLRPPASSGV